MKWAGWILGLFLEDMSLSSCAFSESAFSSTTIDNVFVMSFIDLRLRSSVLQLTLLRAYPGFISFIVFFKKSLLGSTVLYNVVLASAVQQGDSALCIRTSPSLLSPLTPLPRTPDSPSGSSEALSQATSLLAISHMVVCIRQCYFHRGLCFS